MNTEQAATSATPLDDIGFITLRQHQDHQSQCCSSLQVFALGSDSQQATPNGDGYGMRPIISSQLVHEILDMKINRGLGDCQLVGDLLIAEAVPNESQHV